MSRRSFYITLVGMFIVLLMKLLFPTAQEVISQGAGKLFGLDRNSAQLIESMGGALAENGLHNSIIIAFEEARSSELYPAAIW